MKVILWSIFELISLDCMDVRGVRFVYSTLLYIL